MPEAPSAILVYEHITGGGVPADRPLPAWSGEAAAVLRATAGLFREWGRLPVVTTRDRRLAGVDLPADEVVAVEPGSGPSAVAALARRCGAALVIAPETGGVLERVSALAGQDGVLLLGSPASAVAAAADKWALWCRLRAAGLPVPAARPAGDAAEARQVAAALGYPVVVKPRLGASCEGVSLAADPGELETAVGAALAFGPILVQRFAPGAPVSVTLLAARGRACALCLNAQDVALGAVSAYRGGVTGIGHPRRDEVFRVAREAAALVPGLHGLVGVDLVAADDACAVLEINARVTTPVLGLRRALALDLAAAWWTACVDGVLPAGPVRVRRPVPFAAEGADES